MNIHAHTTGATTYSGLSMPAVDQVCHYVLVLTTEGEPDLAGIWGPYTGYSAAERALEELKSWPIDGAWEIVRLKYYPSPPTVVRG